jgi:hypothetical protein
MTRTCIALLALAALVPAARADDKFIGPPPRIVLVSGIDRKEGQVSFHEIVSRMVPKEIEREVVRDGVKVKVKEAVFVPEFTTMEFKFALKDVQVYDGAGKKVDADDALKRLEVKAPVLIAAGSLPVDPAYLKLLNKDALVFVPTPKTTSIPPPPPPPDKPKDKE